MKKGLFIIVAIAFALVSCNMETFDNTVDENLASKTNIVFDLTANHPFGIATKAIKTEWENGDVIYVFFNNVTAPKYLKMLFDGSQWTNIQMNGASEGSLGLAENAHGTMRAVYLPFGSTLTVGVDDTAFTFSEITYSYYLTATLAYTVRDGKVSGTFQMAIPDGYIQFFLDDANASSSTSIELREPHLTPQGIASVAADGTIIHTTVAHGAPLKGYVYDKAVKESDESKGYLFSGILADVARNVSTDYYFTVVSGGWLGAYYAKAFAGRTWYRGAEEGRALKMPALSGWTAITDYKPIDLGLDVNGKRIYWSSRNLGATQSGLPTADTDEARHATWGDYYAWGEIAPYYLAGHAYDEVNSSWEVNKTGYDWTSYSYANNNNPPKFSKYTASKNAYATSGTADGLTQLELADDASHVNLPGTLWRMPTYAEWSALVGDQSNWEWLPKEKGRKVKGTTEGYTDRFIFLPAAGYRADTYLQNPGYLGYYWSSSLDLGYNPDSALDLRFDSSRFIDPGFYRYYGFSVRPVSE